MNFLDKTGLAYFWSKAKTYISTQLSSVQTTIGNYTINGKKISSNPTISKSDIGLGNVTNESKETMFSNPTFTGVPKAPTPAGGSNDTTIATTAFVKSSISGSIAAADAMIYKGTIGTDGTVKDLPNTTAKIGWTYKVSTAGTYAGVVCEIGDMIICLTEGSSSKDATWTVIQANIDGAVTGPSSAVANHIATFNGTTGRVIKDSGFTIATSVPANAKFTDTTYSKATSSSNGLMSKEDKSKLDDIVAITNAEIDSIFAA